MEKMLFKRLVGSRARWTKSCAACARHREHVVRLPRRSRTAGPWPAKEALPRAIQTDPKAVLKALAA